MWSAPPRQRKPEGWNFTFFILRPDGNLDPAGDTDVEPTPYEMCLIYAGLEEIRDRPTSDGTDKGD
jgi:hypothetical protein